MTLTQICAPEPVWTNEPLTSQSQDKIRPSLPTVSAERQPGFGQVHLVPDRIDLFPLNQLKPVLLRQRGRQQVGRFRCRLFERLVSGRRKKRPDGETHGICFRKAGAGHQQNRRAENQLLPTVPD